MDLGDMSIANWSPYGIKPGAFIFAGGVYSDLEVILTQQFLPLLEIVDEPNERSIDPDKKSLLIARNLGSILHAIRKKRKNIQLQDSFNSMILILNPLLFTGSEMPRYMLRFVTSPSLIIHGSADLDISVWNATSIEQAIKQNVISPERIIMRDRDHWFRPVPGNSVLHQKERIRGDGFQRKTDMQFFQECLLFIRQISGLADSEQKSIKRS